MGVRLELKDDLQWGEAESDQSAPYDARIVWYFQEVCRRLSQRKHQPDSEETATTEADWCAYPEAGAWPWESWLVWQPLFHQTSSPATDREDRLLEKMDQLMERIERLVSVMEQAILERPDIVSVETKQQITPSIEAFAEAYERERVALSIEEFKVIYDESVLEAMEFEEELP